MTVITGRQFRANQSKYIGLAQSGERVILSSKAGYMELTPVPKEDEEVKEHINSKYSLAMASKARNEFKEGKTLSFANASEAQRWMDSL